MIILCQEAKVETSRASKVFYFICECQAVWEEFFSSRTIIDFARQLYQSGQRRFVCPECGKSAVKHISSHPPNIRYFQR